MTEIINLDTGEVLHSTTLAIPKPGDIVTPGFAEQVRAWIEEQDDFDLVDDHRRRLAAFEHYVRGKEMRSETQAAARWGEVRVGQLIGQASPNGKYPTDVPGLNALNPEERVWFRRLADHVDVVEECINGIDADGEPCTPKTSRSAILNEISYRLTRDNPPELPEDTFSCIVIDPPWQMGKIEREERPRQDDEIDYATLPVDCGRDGPHSTSPLCCISAIPLKDLAGPEGAHLYLWVTHKYLPAGLELVEHWGFRYQCLMTWRKNVGITPYSWMYDTEHVIFARRGNLDLQQLGLRLSFDAPVVGHSTKPDIFYDRIIAASPEPRLEMFARRPREGFTTWGNET